MQGLLKPFLTEVIRLRNYTLTKEKKNLSQRSKKLLKKYKVHHFVANDKVKASIIWCFNKMLKNDMWRYFIACISFHYIDALSKFIKSWNFSFHGTVGARPVDVNAVNSARVCNDICRDEFKITESAPFLKKGYYIRVVKTREIWEMLRADAHGLIFHSSDRYLCTA